MNRLLISAAALALCGCMWRTDAPAVATTEVMVFFDAEDYTSDRPNDALRDLCNLFHDEGFVVHIALAGYLAHCCVGSRQTGASRWRRSRKRPRLSGIARPSSGTTCLASAL